MKVNHSPTYDQKRKEKSREYFRISATSVGSTLPTLHFGNDLSQSQLEHNFIQFQDSMKVYAEREFGNRALFLSTFEVTIPDLPKVDEERYQVDIAYKIVFDEECKMIAKEKRDWENDKKFRLWALIIGQLSRTAREELERYPDWETMNRTRDPLLLWQRVFVWYRTKQSSQCNE